MSLQTDGLDDRAGRILVLSTGDLPLASLEQLVHSITGRSHREGTEGQVRLSDVVHYDEDGDEDEDGASSFVTTRPVAPPTSSTDAPSTSQIPWTIDNTYYTADVHFRLVSLPSSSSSSAPSRGATAQAKRREREEELQTLLKTETKDVTAIVLVVRGGQTLKEHERVLDALQQCATEPRISQEDAEDATLSQSAATPSLGAESSTAAAEAEMPMGFGLAVSTVISLPSIVDAHTSRTFQSKPASRDALLDLYAQNGWEYIDLGADTDSGVSGMGTTSASTALLDDSASEGSEERAGDASFLSSSGSEDDEEADDEAAGLERVKEALEANMWPGLVRKDRSGGTASQARAGNLADGLASSSSMTTSALPQDRLAALSQILDANESIEQDGAELDAGLDAELDSLFRRLDLNLPSGSLLPPTSPSAGLDTGLGLGAHAEPTAQDEELARRFLASIADFEKYQFAEEVGIGEKQEGEPDARKGLQGDREAGGKILPESEEERNRNQAEALRKLEEWLQNEDGNWPGASTSTSKGGLDFGDSDPDFAGQADAQGKDNKVRLPPRAAGDTFDDDFDEFISASASASGGEGGGANVGPASFGFDEELSRHPHYKPAVDAKTQGEGKSQSKDHGLGGVGGGDSDSDFDGDAPPSTAFHWPEAQAGDMSLGDQGSERGSVPAEEVSEDAVEPSSSSSQGPFHSFPASVEFGERIDADADDLVVEQ